MYRQLKNAQAAVGEPAAEIDRALATIEEASRLTLSSLDVVLDKVKGLRAEMVARTEQKITD